MLSKEAVDEFKQIYQKEYGVQLSDEEAAERANNLMLLYRAVVEDDGTDEQKGV